jgi:dihydroneopterin aldolase
LTVRLLASVTDADEAREALAGGADLVDAKDPARGPLGAPEVARVAAIVAEVAGRVPVSATLGHDRDDAAALLEACGAFAAAGVAYLKVGLGARAGLAARLAILAPVARRHALVVVPLADRALAGSEDDLALVDAIAGIGARGVLFDTHDKRDAGGRRLTLRDFTDVRRLAVLARRAHARGLLCGFAGGLGVTDVRPLAALDPDLLGFRGALCAGADRAGRLASAAVREVRAALDACGPRGSAPPQPFVSDAEHPAAAGDAASAKSRLIG